MAIDGYAGARVRTLRFPGVLAVWIGLVHGGCDPSPTRVDSPQTRDPAPAEAAPEAQPEAKPERQAAAKPEAAAPEKPAVAPTKQAEPATSSIATRLGKVRSDPAPRHLVRDTHYWISNEQSHFLWHESVSGVGGAFVGVATDQNYLLAAWANSELLVLMDFDAGVVDLHHAYGVFFRASETTTEFLRWWSEAGQEEAIARLKAELGEQAPASIEAYRNARSLVAERLAKVDAVYRERSIPTFLSDAKQYEHIRGLWQDGRVLAIRGDLTADATMVDLGQALRDESLEVGVLYLSNAEQYFKYTPRFRRNIVGLPMSERGVVLRTHGWKQFGYVADEEYHYNVQPASLFSQWMAEGHAWGVPKMLEHRNKTGIRGSSILDEPPPKVPGRGRPKLAP